MEINDNLDVKGTLRATAIQLSDKTLGDIRAEVEDIPGHEDTLDTFLVKLLCDLKNTMVIAQECSDGLSELSQTIAGIKSAEENIAAEHNKAIEVINNLCERITALESNYDPTVIK